MTSEEDLASCTIVCSIGGFVGVLVRNDMIDVGLIYSLLGLAVLYLWEGLEHLIIGD